MKNFFRRYLLLFLLLLLLVVLLGYYLWWHWNPFTQNAFVFANTRPVSVWVEGFITEIRVRNNQFVRKGEVMFRVFRPPYQLRADTLRHQIAENQARLRAVDARIRSARSEVRRVSAVLANNRFLAESAAYMYSDRSVSQTYNEERFRARQASEAALEGAGHNVSALECERDGTAALIKSLQSQYDLANVYLSLTDVTAMTDGYVTNMTISPGGYYRPGDVLCGFIASDAWFVQANFKETELSELRAGLKATIWLWQYPGRAFTGRVEAVGWGVERRKYAPETGLATVEKENEWFLLPQRFPVQIRIDNPPGDAMLHPGGSAFVRLEAPARPVRQFFWQLFLWE